MQSTELPTFRSSQRKFSIKKAVLKKLAIFAWKHLFWSLFLISCQSFEKETATQVLHRCKIFKNTYFQGYMYGRLFLYSRILKIFFWKMKKWQIENLEKSEILEITEKLFRVFDFALQPKSETRIWNSWKKISQGFRDFDPADLTQNKGMPKYYLLKIGFIANIISYSLYRKCLQTNHILEQRFNGVIHYKNMER